MTKWQFRLSALTSAFILALVMVLVAPGGTLFAQEGGSATSPGSSAVQGNTANPSSPAGVDPYSQPSGASSPSTSPTQANGQGGVAGVDNSAAPTPANEPVGPVSRGGFPWGWSILSFIVGLIVGGLAFRRPAVIQDRDNVRRVA